MSIDLRGVAAQPYFASVLRAVEKLKLLGQPLSTEAYEKLVALAKSSNSNGLMDAESLIAPYTLVHLIVDADGRGTATAGLAPRNLVEHGWKAFLLRIENPHALEDDVEALVGWRSWGARQFNAVLMDTINPGPIIERQWLEVKLEDKPPLNGFEIEFRVIELCSRDRGERWARFSFGVGRGGSYYFRQSEWAAANNQGLELEFHCVPSHDVNIRVADVDGQSCVAAITIKDPHGHVYPSQILRLPPDMAFQPHVYRGDGEAVTLPEGTYTVECWRGPEYVRKVRHIHVTEPVEEVRVNLERWIDPAVWGWYPGDVHIHAAGCSHFMQPTRGVNPETMIRHVRGEALAVGQVLTWGPAWNYQKQFFSGHAISPAASLEHPDLQASNNVSWKPQLTQRDGESLLRYDVEVSGFPSSICGHLILLRLQQQEFPGTHGPEDWPSWNLPILQWAMKQGAVVGYAHCGFGMNVSEETLPNYLIPSFDSVGTNEGIVDVTHGALDFIGGCELNPAYEMNAWYHMLSCGFRLVFAGETDYPCIYDERPGVGRSYVRLDARPSDDAGYQKWIASFREGRLYAGDGRSHFLDFQVNGHRPGDPDLMLDKPAAIQIRAFVAARLEPQITEETEAIRRSARFSRPAWHLERARIGHSREVALELVVNGEPVKTVNVLADGEPREVSLDTYLDRSSWVSIRIMPSSHSHPVFVHVGAKPVRASRRSAEWLRTCVDRLWEEKHRFIRENERGAAAEAYDHARRKYEAIIEESDIP
jgi:hypothetical protein